MNLELKEILYHSIHLTCFALHCGTNLFLIMVNTYFVIRNLGVWGPRFYLFCQVVSGSDRVKT